MLVKAVKIGPVVPEIGRNKDIDVFKNCSFDVITV